MKVYVIIESEIDIELQIIGVFDDEKQAIDAMEAMILKMPHRYGDLLKVNDFYWNSFTKSLVIEDCELNYLDEGVDTELLYPHKER